MRIRGASWVGAWVLISMTGPGSLSAVPRQDGPERVPTRLQRLAESLRGSCAGRSLLEAMSQPRSAGLAAGLTILAADLESGVRMRTGIPVDAEDLRLLDAARELHRLPRKAACDPTVAVMVLLDEWCARASGTDGPRDRHRRLVHRLRGRRPPGGPDLQPWLDNNFPLLYRDAARIIQFLTWDGRQSAARRGGSRNRLADVAPWADQ